MQVQDRTLAYGFSQDAQSDLATPRVSPGPRARPRLGLSAACHGELNKMGMCSLTATAGLLQPGAFQHFQMSLASLSPTTWDAFEYS